MEESALEASPFEVLQLGPDWYAGCQGYDPCFLAQPVDLPTLAAEWQADVAPLLDDSGYELKYTHFSVVMSKSRQLAFFTAVNIDGQNMVALKRSKDAWYFDPRMERNYQMGSEVYKHPQLDRGHLVRRLDPVWGPDAKSAGEQTFHFTNCSPQHSALNQRTWLGLEDYILDNSKAHEVKVTVFTGPVLRDNDALYLGKYQIPAEFWKVVALVKEDGQLSATAYIQSQRDLISDLEAWGGFGEYKTYQVPVSHIEQLAGLDFCELRQHDPLRPTALESTLQVLLIDNLENLIL